MLVTDRPRRLLELGAGTGDLTLGLAACADVIEAVEPSSAMLEIARTRQAEAGAPPNIDWLQTTAEGHRYEGPYAGVIAAESLHWMSWEQVFPAVARSLSPSGLMIIVCDRMLVGLPWRRRELKLIAKYSTNREFRPYDLASELATRGLFIEAGREECSEPRFSQSIDDYVESFHSRNGFSRERMGETAADFDRELRELVLEHMPSGRVDAKVVTTVIWGLPTTLRVKPQHLVTT
jgi:ubiquinone/menaquinone biosynthesis C-methylase UbiE